MIGGAGTKTDFSQSINNLVAERSSKDGSPISLNSKKEGSSFDRSLKEETTRGDREIRQQSSDQKPRESQQAKDTRQPSEVGPTNESKETNPEIKDKPTREEKVSVKGEAENEVAEKTEGKKAAAAKGKVTFPVDPATGKAIRETSRKENEIQKPVLEFMDSMESEFGIEPERLLGALANMDDKDLLDPPQETMGQFMNNLELQGEDRQRAENMYTSMLNDIEKADLEAGRFDKNVKMQLLSPHELRQARLQNSIEKLHSKFFLNDTRQPFSGTPREGAVDPSTLTSPQKGLNPDQVKNAIQGDSMDAYRQAAAKQQGRDGAVVVPPVPVPGQQNVPVPDVSSGAQPVAAPNLASMTNLQDAGSSAGAANQTDQALAEMLKNPTQNQNFSGQSFSGGNPSTQMAQSVAPMETMAEGADAGAEGFDELVSTSNGQSANGANQTAKAESVLPTARLSEMAEPTDADAATNAREMVKSARALVRQGGGEMSLKLLPEGMGEVHVKVNVNNGKVDVALITQNQETRKHIESSIGDLRASLADQKLTVETVKVDVADNVEKQLDMNQRQDPQREQAREFMQQFREQNSSFRNAFFTGPGRETSDPGSGPSIDPSSDSKAEAKDKDGRLHVIA